MKQRRANVSIYDLVGDHEVEVRYAGTVIVPEQREIVLEMVQVVTRSSQVLPEQVGALGVYLASLPKTIKIIEGEFSVEQNRPQDENKDD